MPSHENLPPQGYHWVFTDRRDRQQRRLEIVYVHHTSKGECELHAFDRSLPITWDEVHGWSGAVAPGPDSAGAAGIDRFAPVKLDKLDPPGTPSSIPESVHVATHAAWARAHSTLRSADDVARTGGFTTDELVEYYPGDWVADSMPRQPGDKLPAAEDEEALALCRVIEARLVELEQDGFSEVFDGEAKALRTYGEKLSAQVMRSASTQEGAVAQ